MPKKTKNKKKDPITFQNLIFNLQKFWGKYGCVILQPYEYMLKLIVYFLTIFSQQSDHC